MCLASKLNKSAIYFKDEDTIKSAKITSIGCPETQALIPLTLLSLSSIKLRPNDSI